MRYFILHVKWDKKQLENVELNIGELEFNHDPEFTAADENLDFYCDRNSKDLIDFEIKNDESMIKNLISPCFLMPCFVLICFL